MELLNETVQSRTTRHPWNKGKLIGAKPPLRAKHVWAIRTMLQIGGRKRDLALFNLAIDSKLRGCDVVSVKVEDVAPRGYAIDRARLSVRRKRVILSALRSPNKRAKPLTIMSVLKVERAEIFYSMDVKALLIA